jgi:hypothetical protein
MGRPFTPLPVTLICGIITSDTKLLDRSEKILIRHFGPVGRASDSIPFTTTKYYEKEMGEDLTRVFVSFNRLIVDIKAWTNALEQRLVLSRGHRSVNLDPGYVSLSKLVLATTKPYAHRIYMGRGLFEEVTLFFKKGKFQPASWTYPDLKNEKYLAFFKDVRDDLITTLGRSHAPADLSRCV